MAQCFQSEVEKLTRGCKILTLPSFSLRDPQGEPLKWKTEPGLVGTDLEQKNTWGLWRK